MARHLDAVYERGVLRPLEPLSLAEHQRVRVTIDEKSVPSSWRSTEQVNERQSELEWLARNARAYAGQWVALNGSRLVAHGLKLADVSKKAREAGIAEPLFASIPDDDLPFGGW